MTSFDKLRSSIRNTAAGQQLTDYLVAEVASAWRGRIVQKEQVLAVIRMRLRELSD